MGIDVHGHYYTAKMLDRMERAAGPSPGPRQQANLQTGRRSLARTLEQRLELLDASGVDVQVLSAGWQQPYFADRQDAVDCARLVNDTYAGVVDSFGGRYAAFGSVPLPHADEAIAEAVRCLEELKFPGLNLGCSIAGQALESEAFAPFWAELDRRRAVVALHPVLDQTVSTAAMEEYGLARLVVAPLEDTVAALRLVLSGHLSRFPNVQVIVPHLGGVVPFLWSRIDAAGARLLAERGASPDQGSVLDGLHRLHYDAANTSPGALEAARRTLGADRILLGTDDPFMSVDGCVRAIHESSLPPEEIAAILDGNAVALLALPEPA